MNLEYMREFAVLAQCLNYTEAANRLFITQPTLTKHIFRIEQELNAQLLERSKHSVSLTAVGVEFLAACISITEQYDRFLYQSGLEDKGLYGSIRLGMLYYGMRTLSMPVLLKMRNDYPDIKMITQSYQPLKLEKDLLSGAVDVAQTYRIGVAEADDGLVYTDVAFLRFGLIVLKDAAAAEKTSVSVHELDGKDIILNSNTPKQTQYLIRKLNEHKVNFRRIIYTEHIDTMAMDILHYNAPAIMTEISREMPNPDIVFVPFEETDIRMTSTYVYKKDNPNKCISRFIETVREVFPDPHE